eukprot:COSAG05_NODE_10387_length_568_cov_0.946695_1_plen_133_part_01
MDTTNVAWPRHFADVELHGRWDNSRKWWCAAIAVSTGIFCSALSVLREGRQLNTPAPAPVVVQGFSSPFEQREFVSPAPLPEIDVEELPNYLSCDACGSVAWQLRAGVQQSREKAGLHNETWPPQSGQLDDFF